MMAANHRTILRGLTLTVLGAWCLSALGQARPQTVPTPVRDVVESVVIERDDIGGEARVHIQKWILHGRMVVEALELPAIDGVRMVQLAAGEVTTVIAGERAERSLKIWLSGDTVCIVALRKVS